MLARATFVKTKTDQILSLEDRGSIGNTKRKDYYLL